MVQDWVKDYPEAKQINKESLGDNHSLVKMLDFVGENATSEKSGNEKTRIVDFGCATGYFAALLKQSGYSVTGVDINPDAARAAEEFCERVIVADLDMTTVQEIFPDEKFAIATFGDVLEHLRDPWKVLRDVQHILQPNGVVIASIPNIAHGDVRLALLQGDFDYSPLGILDNTHLRFFTKKTVEDLFESSGYLIQAEDTTRLPLFSGSNLVPKLDPGLATSSLAEQVRRDQNSDILQFIIKAVPATLEARHQATNLKYVQLLSEHQQLRRDNHSLRDGHQQLRDQLGQIEEEFNAIELRLEQESTEHQQAQRTTSESLQSLQQALEAEQLKHKQSEQLLAKAKQKHEFLELAVTAESEQKQNLQSQLDDVRQSLLETQHRLALASLDITGMKSSKFWRLRAQWFGVRNALGLGNPDISAKQALLQKLRLAPLPSASQPAPSNLLAVLPAAEVPITDDPLYQNWLNHNYPTSAILKRLASSLPALKYQPLISIVVPVYNTPEVYLRQAIDSVLEQIYPNWELCIADDASTDPAICSVLEAYSAKDDRIKTVFRTENGHISLASNSALEIATGDFVALLDHDDFLTPDALYEIIVLLNQYPEADMIYSDEDKIDDAGKLRDPFFKPDWCPDSFLSRMYTCHLGVYRRSLIEQIGGFRAGYEGSQDYDLVLRFTEKTEQIFHIPKVLYHWRIHEESASSGVVAKPYAYEAGQRAIAEAIKRRSEPGMVTENPQFRGHYTVRYHIQSHDRVSIIIPTRDLGYLLNQCLESIFKKSTYPNYEVILVDNGSTESYTENVISDWLNREPDRFYCYSYTIPFNYSKLNNYGASQAKGKYLLFLNNDTEVITPSWIEAMVEQAQRLSIGAVGARLLYSDHTLQHGGVILGIGGVAGHLHKGVERSNYGYFHRLLDTLNYSAVTAACLMCRRDVFDRINGFNEDLAVAFNDVDFCLSVLKAGFRNICLPHAELYHHESKSRGYEDTPAKQVRFQQEIDYMWDRWKTLLLNDPCYSPNLSLKYEDCKIRQTPESEE